MVEGGSARSTVKDTALVGLEDLLVSLDDNSDRLLCNSSLQLGYAFRGDEIISGNSDTSHTAGVVFATFCPAMVGLRGVGVGVLSFRIVILPVLERIILPATAASVVSVAEECA